MDLSSLQGARTAWSRGATVAFLLLGFAMTADAQQRPAPAGNAIVIGERFTLFSDILGEEREVLVSLPPSYHHSDQHYPVLYMLHGDFYFTYGVAFTERLAARGEIPDVITIGLPREQNDNPRLIHGTPEADLFLRFLEDEAIPFVTNTFRVLEHRTLFGWHYSASFTLHSLLNRPDLFDGYIAASIFPLRTDSIDLSTLTQFISDTGARTRTLYFGSDDTEGSIAASTQELKALLETSAPDGLDWYIDTSSGDGNPTETVYRLLHPGLRAVYQDFRLPRFRDTTTFNALGGLPFIDQFLARREAAYGTPRASNGPIIFSLLRLALDTDDLPLFEGAISRTPITTEGWSVNWYLRYAAFYQRHGKAQEAIKLYQRLAESHPSNIEVFIGLAESYASIEQPDLQAEALEQAIHLAEVQSDVRLADLRADLRVIRK